MSNVHNQNGQGLEQQVSVVNHTTMKRFLTDFNVIWRYSMTLETLVKFHSFPGQNPRWRRPL